MADASRIKATIFVGGLDNAVTTQVLHETFVPFGDVVNVTLPKPELPSSTDPHRGFGYVEFEETEDAEEAIYNMDQSELFGRVIKVAAAKPQKEHNEGLGSKNAIWETEAYAAKYNVSEEDRQVAERERDGSHDRPMDPMEGLQGLDEAGPKPK